MKPVLQALVLAERVYEDKTGKKIICGTFNRLVIGVIQLQQVDLQEGGKGVALPGGTDIGCPSAYVNITDVVGETNVTFQFMNVTKNVVLFETAGIINSPDRLQTIEIIAPLPPISNYCREPGVYSLDILYEGEIIGSHRLTVESVIQPSPPPPNEGQ